MLNKEQKEKVRAAYAEVWRGNDYMADYCTKKVAVLAELPGGEFIPLEKLSIEKRFCFGESGHDYDKAQEAAQIARTSEAYFMAANMEPLDRKLEEVLAQYKMHNQDPDCPGVVLLIMEQPYCERTEQMRDITRVRTTELIEATGPVFIRELPGRSVTIRNHPCRVPTLEELDSILAAYRDLREEHRKKVERYLKRYGLSKVHAWTYWRDA